MVWYLIILDLLIITGSLMSIAIIGIYIKTRYNTKKSLLWKCMYILSVMMIVIIIIFLYASIFGYGKTFESFKEMRPLIGGLRGTGFSFLYYILTYPMYLYIVARIGYLVYDIAMSPYNLKPNKPGFSAVSMRQQTKDEAERFGQGKNFK